MKLTCLDVPKEATVHGTGGSRGIAYRINIVEFLLILLANSELRMGAGCDGRRSWLQLDY